MHSYESYHIRRAHEETVLILVLMEDALVPVHRHYVCVHGFVLILVLMEDALVLLMFFKNM